MDIAPSLSLLLGTGYSGWSGALLILAELVVIQGLIYLLVMLVRSDKAPSRRIAITGPRPRKPRKLLYVPSLTPPVEPFYIFLIPCLNEERVIAASIGRLLAIPHEDIAVVAIDDDSDDRTGEIVAGIGDPRVHLLSRRAPEARQGKGEALNGAIRYVLASGILAGRDPSNVIVCVVDADGRLEPGAIAAVSAHFEDPSVAGVQIGVRINNRFTSLLARMQDMEFVVYTELFQRGRRHWGSVGLGGNGQFMRLAALLEFGDSPWTQSLTEDLDLGVRLLARGWRNEICSTVFVHQQGVTDLGRLLRQRTRWFQGHLQSWTLIPKVIRGVPHRTRPDLLYHLSSPLLLLVSSLLTLSLAIALVAIVIAALQGKSPYLAWIAVSYALLAAPATVIGVVYRNIERDTDISVRESILLGHIYLAYGLIWYVSGWWAVWRVIRRQSGWTKTARSVEPAGVA